MNGICEDAPSKAGEPRFVADIMLGRLAKWLRILGYDTAYNREISPEEILRISENEQRLILTRNSSFPAGETEILFIKSEKPKHQLEQLNRSCGIYYRSEVFFSRCTWCNCHLEQIDRDVAADRVPPYVASTESVFLLCTSCDKIYWRGTHGERFLKSLAGIPGLFNHS